MLDFILRRERERPRILDWLHRWIWELEQESKTWGGWRLLSFAIIRFWAGSWLHGESRMILCPLEQPLSNWLLVRISVLT